MAYVSNVLTQAITATTALTLPPHVSDDIILVMVSGDGGGTLAFTWGGNSTGGAQHGTTQVSGLLLTSAVSSAKCTGTAATCTVTMGTADSMWVHMMVIKDCDTTTWFDVVAAATNVTAYSVTTSSVTTTVADCLLIYYLGMDQSNASVPTMAHSRPGPTATMHFLDSSDNGQSTVTTQAAGAVGWYMQRTAGATPTPVWDLANTEITASFTIAFRNKSGGIIPPYVDDYVENGRQLMTGSWWVSATTRNNQNFKATPLTYANIGPSGAGLATTFDAAAVVADAGLNPYSYALNSTPGSSATNAIGFECGFPTTAIDMTTGWIVGMFHASTAKMAAFNQGSIAQGGGYLVIGAGATNYRAYNIMARDNADGYGKDFAVFSVQANQTQTRSGYSASAPTITAIDKILVLNKGQNATGAFYYGDFHLFQKLVVAGGDANVPVNSSGVADVAKFCRLPVVKKLGAAELTAYVPVQIGGGDAVNFQIDAGAFQFPRIADATKKEINYHGADGAIGISYAGKTGDTIKHTNSVVTSASPYYWEINSAATSAATWDFTGLVVVKANVTLRDVMTFSGMAFSNCGSITATGCTVTDCKISGVPATSASFVATSGTFTYLAVNLSALTAGNHWWTGSDPSTIFQNCAFTGGGGHALNITIAGGNSITLTGNTFTGFGADASTGAALNFTAASGTITVNVVGGSIPTYKTAGATIDIVNAVTVKVTVKDAATLANIENARVLVEADSGGDLGAGVDILTGLTNASGVIQTTVFNFTNTQPVTGTARRASSGYGTLYKPGAISGSITSSGLDVTILLNSDE
jgi:hypothetical protein